MLSKCANPECSAKFRYLHDGKVFRVDFEEHPHLLTTPISRTVGTPIGIVGPKLFSREGPRSPEYFWLCSVCSEQMTLATDSGSVVLLPLPPPVVRSAAAS